MELKVKRHTFTDEYTVGDLEVGNKFICNTLEDKVRILNKATDKVYGKTAIPAGRYRVVMDFSNKYKKIMPHILGVPFFEGIRIHAGNSSNDSCGCILVGRYTTNGWLTESKKYQDQLYAMLKEAQNRGEQIFLTISNTTT